MQHSFGDFLRHGGTGQFDFIQRGSHIIGRRRVGLSLKLSFPNYAALHSDFSERLDEVISENTRMLLNALTPPDTVPTVTEADLRDVSDAKAEALNAWDVRLESILSEYQNHQQRLRPVRTAMEVRLLRAFAGLINQLRQEDLGIERYVWRSRDDAKVRDSHAVYDDRVFQWDEPPEGGHPGEAHNCRCYAEPVVSNVPSNVVLADFSATADAPVPEQIGGFWRGLARSFPAIAGLLSALEEQDRLSELSGSAVDRQAEAASRLGLDTSSEEGGLAAWAHQSYFDSIFRGLAPFVAPRTRETAEIAGQAAALFEMYHPGSITGLDAEASAKMAQFVELAVEAFQTGRLQLTPEDWANGWVEVFPELTEGERRLGQLPGFTPDRIEQWLETYPIEELGLPVDTGSPIPDDPTDTIISTPIPEETGPNIVAQEIGNLTTPNDGDLPDDFDDRSIELANENGVQQPREGRAGARYEAATGTTLARPNPPDPAYDFTNTSNGERIEFKGPVPGVNGAVPEELLDGLIEATVKEANFQSGADRIIVDAEGLSTTQLERLRQELENRISSDMPVDIMR